MFSAAIDGATTRPVYGSSVAAYGFHADNPELLTDDIPPRGARRHYYSAQTAELEEALAELLAGANTDGYVFRPCIVAGPDALTPVRSIPNLQLSERLPSVVMRALELMRALKPVIPDPGVPFQLLHHDDVARALDWYSFPVPDLALGAASELVGRRRSSRRGPVDREPASAGADGHDPGPRGTGMASATPPTRRSGRWWTRPGLSG